VDGLDVEALNDASRVLTELISKWHVDLGDSPEDVLLYHAMASANNNFHGAVHRAAQNPRLSQLIGELQTVFPKDYVARAIRSQEEASLRYVDEHLAIQQALLDRDGARARRLMVSHIESGCMRLLAYLDDRGFWSHD
jgi:DNA-binding GntR family transcriptional regulator